MAPKRDFRGYISGLNSLFRQKFVHTKAGGGMQEKIGAKQEADLFAVPGQEDISRWKKVNGRYFGIRPSMISEPSWIILKVLRQKGFRSYLVGGCVRDMILRRTPKDFDVITTADLKEIKHAFNRAIIIGKRFPICQVNLKGCAVEVSSFERCGIKEEDYETFDPNLPKGCSKIDFVRWRDCANRDFTINSMFYDPFTNEIYDYANAMVDLNLRKMRTITPAHMSFTEDCARILRGLRIGARLGFSFSKEIETAIHELSSSIYTLNKPRLMMELNYMLSYGAAVPSLLLLRRFKLLDAMLPFHDAYLKKHSRDPANPVSSMLMKLFSSLDKVVSCGQPCHPVLWIGLLAFHLALVTKPQLPLTVWTFSSLLYHGNWNDGVKAARQHVFDTLDFEPEILKSFNHMSDEELAQNVSKFASIVKDSMNILTDTGSLQDAMAAKFPSLPPSVTALISKRLAGEVVQLFDVLEQDIQSSANERESYTINHFLLGKGDITEARFVLGKIIMDTLSSGTVNEGSFLPSVGKKSKEITVPLEQAYFGSQPSKKPKLVQNVNHVKVQTLPSHGETRVFSEKNQKATGAVITENDSEISKEITMLEQVDFTSQPGEKQKLIQKVNHLRLQTLPSHGETRIFGEKTQKVIEAVITDKGSEAVNKGSFPPSDGKKSKGAIQLLEQVDFGSQPSEKPKLIQKVNNLKVKPSPSDGETRKFSEKNQEMTGAVLTDEGSETVNKGNFSPSNGEKSKEITVPLEQADLEKQKLIQKVNRLKAKTLPSDGETREFSEENQKATNAVITDKVSETVNKGSFSPSNGEIYKKITMLLEQADFALRPSEKQKLIQKVNSLKVKTSPSDGETTKFSEKNQQMTGAVITDKGSETVKKGSFSPSDGKKSKETTVPLEQADLGQKANNQTVKPSPSNGETTKFSEKSQQMTGAVITDKGSETLKKGIFSPSNGKKTKEITVPLEQADLGQKSNNQTVKPSPSDGETRKFSEKNQQVTGAVITDKGSETVNNQKANNQTVKTSPSDGETRKFSEKETTVTKSTKNTLPRDQTELVSHPKSKKQKIIHEDNKTKLAKTLQEQTELAPAPIKKRKLVQEGHDNVTKEVKPSQKKKVSLLSSLFE